MTVETSPPQLLNRAAELTAALTSRGKGEAETYLFDQVTRKVEIREGRPEGVKMTHSLSAAFRFIRGGRGGLVATTDFSTRAIAQVMDEVVEMSRWVDPDPFLALPFGNGGEVIEDWAEGVLLSLSDQEMETAAVDMETAARRCPGIINTRQASFEIKEETVAVVSSTGVRSCFRRGQWGLGIMTVASDVKGMVSSWEGETGTFLGDLDPVRVGEKAAEKALEKRGAKQSPTGRFPALFDPLVIIGLLGVLKSALSGESVVQKRSFLAGFLGKRWASPLIELADDGLLEKGYNRRPFDDEGVPCRRTVILKEGVLKSFLHNHRTAGAMKSALTGNAIRPDPFTPPSVGTTNLVLAPGRRDAPVPVVDRGVEITDLLGLHTANPITGEVSVGFEGFWVEGGKRRYPIKGGGLGTTLSEIFGKAGGIGKKTVSLGGYSAPCLLAESVAVSG